MPMDINQIPLFSLLQSKLGYVAERQKFIAENVANASTPGFTPQDLKPFTQQPGVSKRATSVVLAQPDGLGEEASGSGSTGFIAFNHAQPAKPFASQSTPDSETTLNGNQVVLEEEMLKMSESRTEYDTAIGFYEKAMNMLHMAAKKPGP